jgi:hypothetical protein
MIQVQFDFGFTFGVFWGLDKFNPLLLLLALSRRI